LYEEGRERDTDQEGVVAVQAGTKSGIVDAQPPGGLTLLSLQCTAFSPYGDCLMDIGRSDDEDEIKAHRGPGQIRLSVEDQRRFVELLLSPPEPTAALERARAAHEALIGPV
jgi:hypothetical protein